MPRAPARTPLDLLILLGVALHALATVTLVVRLRLVEATLATSPAAFGAAFAQLLATARLVLVPAGTLTAMLVLVALVREDGTERRRGQLRIAGVVALVLGGVLGSAVTEPTGRAIVAAAQANGADLVGLLARWHVVQLAGLAVVAVEVATLVAADRAPRAAPVTDARGGGLTDRHRTLLVLLGTTTLFEGYDRFIMTLALPHIARDLGAAEGQLGWALSAIRSGALLAVFLGRAGDRFGRRRLLILTVLAYTVATAATGLSRGLADFVLCQTVALVFLTAELTFAQVVVAEEFPAHTRGIGQGLLGAAGALGAGIAALLFPVFASTALGWRGLYFVGIVPLLVVSWLRRALPETTRWQRLGSGPGGGVLAVLAPAHRLRFVVIMAVTTGASAAASSAFAFASYRATRTFAWQPTEVSTMIVTGGGLGFWGWLVFGRLADAGGRRLTGAIGLVGGSLAIAAYYRTRYLFPAFGALVFCESGMTTAINALGTELFPTALRATAKSWVANGAVAGAMLGLATVGLLAERVGGHAVVIAALGILPTLLAPLLFILPETRHQDLEITSGEIDSVPRAAGNL